MASSAHTIYEPRVLTTTITLLPKYLNNKDIQTIIMDVLRAKVEGSCISDGYIKRDSVEILSRSLGCMENHDFGANISYLIRYKADVCSPRVGQVIECIVDSHDETNSVCYVGSESTSPVEIYLFRDHYIGNAEFAGLKPGQRILVKVLQTEVSFGAEKVLVSAQYQGRA
jgi:hypothetical protein